MKIDIHCESQEEFDDKREELLKRLAGEKFDIIQKGLTPVPLRRSKIKAQNEMMDYWDGEFQKVLELIKEDIKKIVNFDV